MMQRSWVAWPVLSCFALSVFAWAADPKPGSNRKISQDAAAASCELVPSQWGNTGNVPLKVEKVVTGLKVPWGVAFLPNGDWLVNERAGKVRLFRSGRLAAASVTEVKVGETSEGGLLGIALDPGFASNNRFYVFYTAPKNGTNVNRVERFILSPDHATATSDRIILDDIAAGTFHDGGRIKFGPDGMLYVATGDARHAESAQDPASRSGKILRVTPDGGVPADNPTPGSPVFVSGLRNPQAFDWVDNKTLIIADHGPTGEFGLSGLDEVSFARAGENLGWPTVTGCQSKPGFVTPILAWKTAAPPGGGVIYRGDAIPEFRGSFIIGLLGFGGGARQLHRVVFDAASRTLVGHEVYLKDQFGRLRDVFQGPDGALYATTSNCDSRGSCPSDGDAVLRITRAE